jgi:hypothetical protein
MKKYNEYLDNVTVSDRQHIELVTKLENTVGKKRKPLFSGIMPMYAGLVTAAILCVVAIPIALNSGGMDIEDLTTTPIVQTDNGATNNSDTPPSTNTPTVTESPDTNGSGVLTAPNTNAPQVTQRSTPAQTAAIPELRGLPTNNFRLNEVVQLPASTEESQACMAPPNTKLQELFLHNQTKQGFAFVRVTNTKITETPNPHYSPGAMTSLGPVPKTFIHQESTLQVLSTVWSNTTLPTTVTITQSIHGYGGTVTNALRKDGVYLLPLNRFDWDNRITWSAYGEWDVLFEVDNNGRIWSHSQFEGFNRFDGKPAQELANAIVNLTSDSIFKYANGEFGQTAKEGYALAEITINAERTTTTPWGGSFSSYEISVDRVHVPTTLEHSRKVTLGNITAQTWNRGSFAVGNRYLTFVYHNSEQYSIEPTEAAIIGANGRLSQIPEPTREPVRVNSNEDGYEGDGYDYVDQEWEWSTVFDGMYGYTIAQIVDIANRSIEWHNR